MKSFGGLLRLLVGSVIIGAMAVTVTISFAALIYTGPLAPYLGEGANFALLGATVMAAVGAFAYSIRGAITNPQDATVVVLAPTAVSIASSSSVSGDTLFPTVLALLAAASFVAWQRMDPRNPAKSSDQPLTLLDLEWGAPLPCCMATHSAFVPKASRQPEMPAGGRPSEDIRSWVIRVGLRPARSGKENQVKISSRLVPLFAEPRHGRRSH